MQIVLATTNKGKVAELSAMLADHAVEVLGLDAFPAVGEIEETGTTFEENALIKAREAARLTGRIAVADDSGLEVDALSGAPGVYSARYSLEEEPAPKDSRDQANNRKLLRELDGLPEGRRTARFCCVMAAAAPKAMGGHETTAHGTWEGRVATEPAGLGGFGYDPLFYDPELDKTAAQLPADLKNARSHRGKALMALMRDWDAFIRRATQGA